MTTPSTSFSCSKTRLALFWMHLTNEPFIALFTLLGFILKKNLGASIFEISLLAMLNPACSLLSFLLGAYLNSRHQHLVPSLMLSWILGRVLFLILPFYSRTWLVLIAACCYQLFHRASTPATIEILRSNLAPEQRTHFFSSVYVLSFLESLILGLFVGKILDVSESNWKYLLAASALLSMTSLFFQKNIPSNLKLTSKPEPLAKESALTPFKQAWHLVRSSSYFARFQAGFMFGGLGLMIMNPALIIYYNDTLHLSHETITIARYVWMGLGVLGSTFLWKKYLNQKLLFCLTSLIILGFSLFPLCILHADSWINLLYVGFFIYGIAQAGSHLVWHLSGTFFAPSNESSCLYTATNILAVGIRGLIGPCLGGILTQFLGPSWTLAIGSLVCISGVIFILPKKDFKTQSRSV